MASPETLFLQDFAVVTGVAALASVVFQRLKFPLVFGLLAAGVVIGPNTPPVSLIQDEGTLQVLANLGIVLLLFGLGLDFNLRGLRKFGLGASVITAAEVLLMFWVGFEVGRLLGWSRLDSAFLGAMLSISSTAIIVGVLREMNRLDAEASRVVFGVLVLEDVAAIVILVLLGGYVATGDLPLGAAGFVVARMLLFLLAFVLLGLLIVPRVLDWIATRYRGEVVVLAILGLGVGGAILSEFSGFHVGLGAFIMGALASEAKHKALLEERFRPIHDLFAAVFFVAIGTLVDFGVLAAHAPAVIVITLAIIVGKILSGTFATFLVGYGPGTAFSVGVALAQVGEFSFVIAALGLSTGVMDPDLFPIIIGVAAITSFTSPMMIRYADRMGRSLGGLVPLPLRTYAAVYTSFLRAWRDRVRSELPPKVARERRNTIVSGALLLLSWGGAFLLQGVGQGFLEGRGFSRTAAVLTYWGAGLVVLVPSLIEFNRHLGRWIDEAHRGRASRTEGLGVRAVVRYTVYFGVSLLVGLPVLLSAGPLLAGPFVLVLWLSVIAIAAAFLLNGIRRLHHQVSDNIGRLLEDERGPVPVPDVLRTLFSQDFPMDFHVGTSVISHDGLWSGRRVADTRLRSATSASMALLERATGEQVVPGPETILLPGDKVTLVGAAEEVDAARALLEQSARGERSRVPLQPGRLFVVQSSPLDGVLLGESNLRQRFGLQVVAIQREGSLIANPGPQERIRAGDTLVVLGTQEQIFGALEALREPQKPNS